jgi:hypothetical protein
MSDKKTRAAKIKRLSDQVNKISAMLSTVHILDAACQVEELLDCSSLADDFARDLDAFVADPGMSSCTAQSVSPIATADSECWTRVGPGTMPPADLTVIVWNGTSGEPCAVFFDPELDCWILRADPTTIHEGAITHWRYCHAPDAGSAGAPSMSIGASPPATEGGSTALTRDVMRVLGRKAGAEALKDLEGCVDPAIAFEGWRDHCYSELAEQLAGHVDLPDLLAAWARARDSVQPLGLTQKESALLEAYRLSDERGRQSIEDYAVSMAEDWPRYTFSVLDSTTPGAA